MAGNSDLPKVCSADSPPPWVLSSVIKTATCLLWGDGVTGYGAQEGDSSPDLASFYISSHTGLYQESSRAQEVLLSRYLYLCTHDCNLSCGPRIVGVTKKVFGAHDIIGTSIGLEQTKC